MLNCLIIDDEPLAGKLLTEYVAKTDGISLAACFTNPITAFQKLEEYTVDFILLDIQMPELRGIQFAKIVQGKYPVILTTAYENYALQGYELNIVDYLLKPISLVRFQQAVQKLQAHLSPQGEDKRAAVPKTAHDYIFIKSGYQTKRIEFDNILYLESMSDYVRIQTRQGAVLTLDNMKNLITQLPENRFMRVHRSFIIGLDKIDYIENNRIVIKEKHIPISATYQEEFWRFINNKK